MEQRQDAGSAKVLFPLYAGKCGMLTAVLQYVYQAVVLGGSGMTEEGKELEAIAGEKLCDFERIGTLLGSSGVDPVFTACPPYPVSYHSAASVDYAKSYPAMLAADLRLEAALSARLEQAAAAVSAPHARVLSAALESSRRHEQRLKRLSESAPRESH